VSVRTVRRGRARGAWRACAFALAASTALGCGGDTRDGGDGWPFADGGPRADAGVLGGGGPITVFAFDDSLGALLRLSDGDGDGDLHDAGESVAFYDGGPPTTGLSSSPALLALGPRTVLATDAESATVPRDDDVVRLDDADGDGDAFDPDEAGEMFDGALPGGDRLTRPIALAQDGAALSVADSNQADPAARFGVYRLVDDDGDGVVQLDEAELYLELAAPGSHARAIGDLEVVDGRVWMIGAEATAPVLYQIDPATRELTIALTGDALREARGLILPGASGRMAASPSGELVVQAVRVPTPFAVLLAVRDAVGDGSIDPTREVRVVWDEARHAGAPTNFAARDLAVAPDGTLVVLVATQGTIHGFADLDGDGDYDDPGEDRVVYDTAQAVAAGGPNTPDLLSVAAAAAE
jgi:hypothetical protein